MRFLNYFALVCVIMTTTTTENCLCLTNPFPALKDAFARKKSTAPNEVPTQTSTAEESTQMPKPDELLNRPGKWFISKKTQAALAKLMQNANDLMHQAKGSLNKADTSLTKAEPLIKKATDSMDSVKPVIQNADAAVKKANSTLSTLTPILSVLGIAALLTALLGGGLLLKQFFFSTPQHK